MLSFFPISSENTPEEGTPVLTGAGGAGRRALRLPVFAFAEALKSVASSAATNERDAAQQAVPATRPSDSEFSARSGQTERLNTSGLWQAVLPPASADTGPRGVKVPHSIIDPEPEQRLFSSPNPPRISTVLPEPTGGGETGLRNHAVAGTAPTEPVKHPVKPVDLPRMGNGPLASSHPAERAAQRDGLFAARVSSVTAKRTVAMADQPGVPAGFLSVAQAGGEAILPVQAYAGPVPSEPEKRPVTTFDARHAPTGLPSLPHTAIEDEYGAPVAGDTARPEPATRPVHMLDHERIAGELPAAVPPAEEDKQGNHFNSEKGPDDAGCPAHHAAVSNRDDAGGAGPQAPASEGNRSKDPDVRDGSMKRPVATKFGVTELRSPPGQGASGTTRGDQAALPGTAAADVGTKSDEVSPNPSDNRAGGRGIVPGASSMLTEQKSQNSEIPQEEAALSNERSPNVHDTDKRQDGEKAAASSRIEHESGSLVREQGPDIERPGLPGRFMEANIKNSVEQEWAHGGGEAVRRSARLLQIDARAGHAGPVRDPLAGAMPPSSLSTLLDDVLDEHWIPEATGSRFARNAGASSARPEPEIATTSTGLAAAELPAALNSAAVTDGSIDAETTDEVLLRINRSLSLSDQQPRAYDVSQTNRNLAEMAAFLVDTLAELSENEDTEEFAAQFASRLDEASRLNETSPSSKPSSPHAAAGTRQNLNAVWLRSMLAAGNAGLSAEGGWNILKLELSEEEGTLTIKTLRTAEAVHVQASFSENRLQHLFSGLTDRLEEGLASRLDSDVEFSLFSQNRDPQGREVPAGRSPAQTNRTDDEPNDEYAPSSVHTRSLSARYEWVG